MALPLPGAAVGAPLSRPSPGCRTRRATKSSQLGSAGTAQKTTTLEYSPDQADQARELADLMRLAASALKPGKSEANAQGLPAIVLRIGQDFKGAGTAAATAPAGISHSTADEVKCAS